MIKWALPRSPIPAIPLESTGPTSLWLHCSVQAELFPIHQQCQEEEAAAVRKSCSFVLGEKAGKRLLKWEEDDKKSDKQLILFWSFQEGSIQPSPVLEEVSEPSMAKSGPDQLLWFKWMLQEHSHSTGGNWGLTDAALCKQILREDLCPKAWAGKSPSTGTFPREISVE